MQNVQVKINDQTLEVPQGTPVIEACKKLGIEVPHYCYHPALTPVGSCRMCQVEIKDAPDRPGRVTIACRTSCTNNMVVDTRTDGVKLARAGALEFYLSNHPLDCPICDKAGECFLQDYSYKFGFGQGRFGESRRKGVKRTPLGGHIIFDSERCVLCTRCTRFMDEYAKAPQLAVIGRGAEATIGIFPGRPLDSNYTGNLADICPVGALTLEEFRFKSRVWDLKTQSSLCPLCSRGCNVLLDSKQNQLLRVRPRTNADVNGHFICNVGRFDYLPLASPRGRVTSASERGAVQDPTRTREVLARVAASLATATSVLVVLSARLTNEELVLLKQVLPAAQFVLLKVDAKGGDHILLTGDPWPNREGVRALGPALGIEEITPRALAAAANQTSHAVVFDGALELPPGARQDAVTIVQDVLVHPSWLQATWVLPGTTPAEKSGTFVNVTRRLQKLNAALRPPAGIRSEFDTWVEIGRAMGIVDLAPTAAKAFAQVRSELGVAEATTFDGMPALGVALTSNVQPATAGAPAERHA
ncbi:MAG: 2Fe-2S iron-sulfur cluster-binding protein [Planctomycetota bacterium]